MPSNPKNTVSTVIPGPRVRILLPPPASQLRTRLNAIVAHPRAITPLVVPSDLPFRNPEHRELWLSGLRLDLLDMW
jgi:hypothetical protein